MQGKIELGFPLKVNPSDYEIGVIVARFQTPTLHKMHTDLIDTVCNNHNKVIIFLGISRVQQTEKNPLDFTTRKLMIQEKYPEITVLPLTDQRSNARWSHILDNEIPVPYGNRKALLYGGRDSFIPYYEGKYDTVELVGKKPDMSGTAVREATAKDLIRTEDGRKGVIYANYGRYAITYPTVDVVAYKDNQILLGKKPGETKYRFVGGFVDATDANWEEAAKREFKEETGGEIGDLSYIASARIDDWRYSGEKDGIMTTLFIGELQSDNFAAADDIEDCKLFNMEEMMDYEVYSKLIMEEHVPLFGKLVEYFKKNLQTV